MSGNKLKGFWKECDNLTHNKQASRREREDRMVKYKFILRAEKKYLNGKAKKLLDVGSGSGTLTSMLNGRYEVAGIDKNQKSISNVRKTCPDVKVYKADMRNFKLKDRFDIITCVCAIDHGDDLRDDFSKTLKNLCAHLNKKGMVIFDMPFLYDTWGHDNTMDVYDIRGQGGEPHSYF